MKLEVPLSLEDIYAVGYELNRRREAVVEAKEAFREGLRDQIEVQPSENNGAAEAPEFKGQELDLVV